MREPREGRRVDLAVLGLYVLASLVYAWPLIRHLGTRLAGDGYDMYVFQWGNWWITRSLGHFESPYHTSLLFYPQGADLYFLSFSWLNTFVWWPLQALVGQVMAYNLTVWWSWPLTGWGGYLLARELTGDRRAAFVAGVVLAFYPYHFAQRNHLNLLSVQWIPFFLYFLARVVRTGRWRNGALSGLCLALAGLSGWHLMTLAALIGLPWLLYLWFVQRSLGSAGTGQALLIGLVVWAILVTPFLWPLVGAQVADSGQDPYLKKEGETQTDLVAYVLPNLYHPLWGDRAAPVHSRFLRNKDHSVALGYTCSLLVVYAFWRARRAARFWLGALLVFGLLALGPFPRINGTAYPDVPLPYRLVGWTPVVQSLRTPERFNILVGLCLAMVVAFGLARLGQRWSPRRTTRLTLIVASLVLLEYWAWPFPTRLPDVPDFYRELAEEPGEFAIVDVPIGNDPAKLYMFYQTVHGRPTVTGHVSRPPQGAYDFIEANGLLRALWATRRPDPMGDPAAELTALADRGVCYLVVHRDRLGQEGVAALANYLPLAPAFSDDRLIVYSICPRVAR